MPFDHPEYPRLRLFVLGSFRLEYAGEERYLPTRKSESLLAYLALHPEPQARGKLAELFWGDSTDELARRSLRTALASIRKVLSVNDLITDRETVQLIRSGQVWIDAVEFQQQATYVLADESLDASTIAFDLYRSELLTDFYDDWIANKREHLRTLYLETLLRLIRHWRTRGEYARAIETAHRLLTVDIAHEQAHQHAMFCLWSLGNRSAAINQFVACQHALRDELGVEPSLETLALFERIQKASPATPSPAAAHTNLPIPLTSFIGREYEIATVKQLLTTTRLLTLTGVGGCGKTRLAIRVAHEVLDQFVEGIWWLELAAAHENERVLQLIVKSIGLTESQQHSPLAILLDFLRTKRALLVIDNCEHLVQACAEIAAVILSHCPHIRILATSREVLNISGEIAFRVPSLSLPKTDDTNEPTHLLQSESVRLFVERAAAVRHDFTLTWSNAVNVADICRQLDGIPFALELAAARLKTLSVEQIKSRLIDRFGLLTMGSRVALPRQQTLQATIDWSYDLLPNMEQTLLQRLSVFSGGWSLEAAEAVGTGNEVERSQVIDLLTRLADKSLLNILPREDVPRFSMLETIRHYAHWRGGWTNEDEAHRCHAQYFIAFAQRADAAIRGSQQLEWLRRLDEDHDNLLVALDWLVDNNEIELALHLASALAWYWELRGFWTEGAKRLKAVLDRADPLDHKDTWLSALARTLNGAGRLECSLSHLEWSRALLDRGLVIARQVGDQFACALILHNLANVVEYMGDFDLAAQLRTEEMRVAEALGDKWCIAWAHMGLGYIEQWQDNIEGAWKHYAVSLDLRRTIGDAWGIARSMFQLGFIAKAKNDWDKARSFLEDSLAIYRQLGHKGLLASILSVLADVVCEQGDFDRATSLLHECLRLTWNSGSIAEIADSLAALTKLAYKQSAWVRAARMFGASTALYDEAGYRMSPTLRTQWERLRTSILTNANEFVQTTTVMEMEIGRSMAVHEIVRFALEL